MWMSRKARILFLHNPRAAGGSMIIALEKAFDDFESWAPDPKAPYHIKDHGTVRPPGTQGFQVITSIRNPFIRELSFYLWCKRVNDPVLGPKSRSLDFHDYIEWRLRAPPRVAGSYSTGTQTAYLGTTPVDHFVRYEDLPGAFCELPCLRGRVVTLPHKRGTRNDPYELADHYDYATMAAVRLYAYADFLQFDYDPLRLP